jgi:hypothetical protein
MISRSPRSSMCACGRGRRGCRLRQPIRGTRTNGRICAQQNSPDDKILIPGMIDSTTNFVEHPRLIAQRICHYADIIGRERVIAGADCGLQPSPLSITRWHPRWCGRSLRRWLKGRRFQLRGSGVEPIWGLTLLARSRSVRGDRAGRGKHTARSGDFSRDWCKSLGVTDESRLPVESATEAAAWLWQRNRVARNEAERRLPRWPKSPTAATAFRR